MNTKNCYVYFLKWSKNNKMYYGVRYADGCDPSDLWKTYFTSSDYVKKFRKKYGEPDIIQIRKTFGIDSSRALSYERKFLNKLKVASDNRWLNVNSKGTLTHEKKNIIKKNKNNNLNSQLENQLSLSDRMYIEKEILSIKIEYLKDEIEYLKDAIKESKERIKIYDEINHNYFLWNVGKLKIFAGKFFKTIG